MSEAGVPMLLLLLLLLPGRLPFEAMHSGCIPGVFQLLLHVI